VGEEDVWDIEVEDDHSYLAHGFIHHNSCSNPNLQQVPARDPELGPLIRGLFLPEKGQLWGALDYSSQEPRLTVHYAHLTGQPGSSAAVAGYNENERMDYHQMVADLANISRKSAKVINLGLAYGMGGVKLCHSLGLPTVWVVREQGKLVEVEEGTPGAWETPGSEGVELLKQYHNNVPFVKGVNELCIRLAGQRGWIRTYYNRLCRFDLWEPIRRPKGWEFEKLTKEQAEKQFGKGCVKRAFTHKALNRLIQGSAADMTKLAMREMWREGIVPLMTMHDELDISTDDHKLALRCEEIMKSCVDLSVPVVVDCEFGRNWGEAKYSWEEAKGLAE
jgi:DNA polymerase I-like protein with 3'-5' exonuclease and polymerase domains